MVKKQHVLNLYQSTCDMMDWLYSSLCVRTSNIPKYVITVTDDEQTFSVVATTVCGRKRHNLADEDAPVPKKRKSRSKRNNPVRRRIASITREELSDEELPNEAEEARIVERERIEEVQRILEEENNEAEEERLIEEMDIIILNRRQQQQEVEIPASMEGYVLESAPESDDDDEAPPDIVSAAMQRSFIFDNDVDTTFLENDVFQANNVVEEEQVERQEENIDTILMRPVPQLVTSLPEEAILYNEVVHDVDEAFLNADGNDIINEVLEGVVDEDFVSVDFDDLFDM